MIRFFLLLLVVVSSSRFLYSMRPVALYYRHAVPEKRRFFGRSEVALQEGYRTEFDAVCQLARVLRIEKGEEVGEWRFFYAAEGLLNGCDRFNAHGTRKEGWRYDSAARIRKWMVFVGRGRYNRLFRVNEFFYDRQGVLRSQQELIQGKLSRTVQYVYHPTGELFARADHSPTGALLERTVYRMDDRVRPQEALLYRRGRLAAVYVYRYSAAGGALGRVKRKPRQGDPLQDPLQERVKPLPQ